MKGAILGFQKRVWCPKWTPASSISRMVTDMVCSEGWVWRRARIADGARAYPARPRRPRHPGWRGVRFPCDGGQIGPNRPESLAPPRKGCVSLQLCTTFYRRKG
ncbi:hypothetical protein GCM10023144_34620 [Pigmentiphaga soli]|uniref:Uncharacterized protein n=1 Tax=Pigmentiphaga soli TaxID=1007095 RepID=A0ABP8HDZ4_9BURK